MTSLAQSNRYLRLCLIGPCANVSLAAPTLAHHLGISAADATARLSQATATLADRIETSHAQRLAALLSALGVAVQLEPAGAQPQATPPVTAFELSIQPAETEDIAQLSRAISQALPPLVLANEARKPDQIQNALAGPGGFVLTDMTSEQIHKLRRAFRKIGGLRLATSSTSTALYDILHDPRSSSPKPATLGASLKVLGLAPCKVTGALASRLDARMRDHVLRRFAGMGLIAMNRDFQRFDLFLTGTQNLSPRELADFLVIRSDLPRQLLERMLRPLRIEAGLTRANALAFQADYAALGLETCARLRVYHPMRANVASRVMP